LVFPLYKDILYLDHKCIYFSEIYNTSQNTTVKNVTESKLGIQAKTYEIFFTWDLHTADRIIKYTICEIKQNNKNGFQTDQTGCRYGLLYAEETCKNSFSTDVFQAS